MTNEIFILILGVLCITDLLWRKIPNIIVLPAILVGGILTGQWLPALLMLLLGMLFYSQQLFCGGDVKLLAMIGAFIGWHALPAFAMSRIIVYIFRLSTKNMGALPYAPFIGIASVIFLLL